MSIERGIMQSRRSPVYLCKPERCYYVLDVILSLFGLKLYNAGRLRTAINVITRTWFIILTYYAAVRYSYILVRKRFDLLALCYVNLIYAMIACHHILWFKRNDVVIILNQAFEFCDSRKRILLRKASKVLLALLITLSVASIVVQLYAIQPITAKVIFQEKFHRLSNDTRTSWWHKLAVQFYMGSFAFFIDVFYVFVVLLYVYQVYAMHLTACVFYEMTCPAALNSTQDGERTYRELIATYKAMLKLRELFYRTYEFIPFVLISYLFSLVSGEIVLCMGKSVFRKASNYNIAYESVLSTTYIGTVLIMIFAASHFVDKIELIKNDFVINLCIYGRKEHSKKFFVDLLTASELRITAWQLFSIHKRHIILPFISGLISFSILFATLAGVDLGMSV